jgi:hypothetical protein
MDECRKFIRISGRKRLTYIALGGEIEIGQSEEGENKKMKAREDTKIVVINFEI